MDTVYDVIVVGGGNAALVAAIAAKHRAERVLLLERAPEWIRGGNSRHTRDIRASHDGCGHSLRGRRCRRRVRRAKAGTR